MSKNRIAITKRNGNTHDHNTGNVTVNTKKATKETVEMFLCIPGVTHAVTCDNLEIT